MTTKKDRIDKAREKYLYDDEDAPYPQEAIDADKEDEMIQDAKEAFREAILSSLPYEWVDIDAITNELQWASYEIKHWLWEFYFEKKRTIEILKKHLSPKESKEEHKCEQLLLDSFCKECWMFIWGKIYESKERKKDTL